VVGSSDTGSASGQRFLEIKEAYDVLKDDGRRRDYDQQLAFSGGSHPHFGQNMGQTRTGSDYEEIFRRYAGRRDPDGPRQEYSEEELRRVSLSREYCAIATKIGKL